MTHEKREHSVFPASSAARWLICPASAILAQEYPSPTSAKAEEGTRAHKLLEYCIKNRCRPMLTLDNCSPEMQDCVRQTLDYIYGLGDPIQVTPERKVPLRVTLPWLPDEHQPFGTLDVQVITPCEMWIIDLKTGRQPVTADCDQLKFYGTAALFEDCYFDIETRLAIVQPLGYDERPIKEAPFTFTDALEFYKRVYAAIKRLKPYYVAGVPIRSLHTAFTPHADACRYCPARHECEYFSRMALGLIGGESLESIAQNPQKHENLRPVVTAPQLIEALPVLKAYVKVLEAMVEDLKGSPDFNVPGYKVVQVPGRRKFKVGPAKFAEEMAVLIGATKDECTPRSILSITDATKLIREKSKKLNLNPTETKELLDRLELLITTESSGNTEIVKNSDPRESINAAMFGHVIQ